MPQSRFAFIFLAFWVTWAETNIFERVSCDPQLTAGVFVADRLKEHLAPFKIATLGLWATGSSEVFFRQHWVFGELIEQAMGRRSNITSNLHEADVIVVSVYMKRFKVDSLISVHRSHAAILFFSPETTVRHSFKQYHDQYVGTADFSVGIGRPSNFPRPLAGLTTEEMADKYMLYPYWFWSALVRKNGPPGCSSAMIVDFHSALTSRPDAASAAAAWAKRAEPTVFVNSHDAYPRGLMVDTFSHLLGKPVACPGKQFNNMPWPPDLPRDTVAGKLALLERFQFNLCPENVDTPEHSYVTEKLVEALVAGTIPVYWGDAAWCAPETTPASRNQGHSGDGDSHEPSPPSQGAHAPHFARHQGQECLTPAAFIFNRARIAFFDAKRPGGLGELNATILRLRRDAEFRESWFKEPVLIPEAAAWLEAYLASLLRRLRLAFEHAARRTRNPAFAAAGAVSGTSGRQSSGVAEREPMSRADSKHRAFFDSALSRPKHHIRRSIAQQPF